MRNTFLIMGLVALVAGCGSDMRAVSSNGETAKFSYEQGFSCDTYFATIGNESFEGRAERGSISKYIYFLLTTSHDFVVQVLQKRCTFNQVHKAATLIVKLGMCVRHENTFHPM